MKKILFILIDIQLRLVKNLQFAFIAVKLKAILFLINMQTLLVKNLQLAFIVVKLLNVIEIIQMIQSMIGISLILPLNLNGARKCILLLIMAMI